MLNGPRSQLLRYSVALVSAGLALLLRGLLTPLWGNELPFLTLFPAVLLSAWYGGLGPGLVTTAMCAAGASYFWLVPSADLGSSRLAGWVGLALAVLVMLLIAWLTAALRRSRDGERAQREFF
jgi:K+-sensing histidine kinase KdpD